MVAFGSPLDVSTVAKVWLTAGLLAASAAVTPMVGCTVTRDAPTMACSETRHCPADGNWVCDTAAGVCVATVDIASVDASSDATATSDSGSDATARSEADALRAADSGASGGDVLSTGGDAAEDATVDPDTFTTDTGKGDATATAGSCAGLCGTTKDDEGCYCDENCAEFGDCCSDYETLCTGGADATGDTALPTDTTSSADAG